MSLERLAQTRLEEAFKAGQLAPPPGRGRPMGHDPADALAGDDRLGFKILRDAGMLPGWLELARDIERDLERLRDLDARHAEWVALAAEHGEWDRHGPTIARLRAAYEERARAIRVRQDSYNLQAPSVALERPALWVDYHLQRLDDRVAAARGGEQSSEVPGS